MGCERELKWGVLRERSEANPPVETKTPCAFVPLFPGLRVRLQSSLPRLPPALERASYVERKRQAGCPHPAQPFQKQNPCWRSLLDDKLASQASSKGKENSLEPRYSQRPISESMMHNLLSELNRVSCTCSMQSIYPSETYSAHAISLSNASSNPPRGTSLPPSLQTKPQPAKHVPISQSVAEWRTLSPHTPEPRTAMLDPPRHEPRAAPNGRAGM